jgi:1-acyl-sn-glycerol-3-phosphate acyltransferase
MKKLIVNVFRFLWRIWFYVLFGVILLLATPFLLIVTAKEKWYPWFFKLAQIWAKIILVGMGFRVSQKVIEEPLQEKSYVFIANHTSMIDIMLMLAVVKNPFVFVGKSELAKIPVFGYFYKKTCILVDRADFKSRQQVFKEAQRKIDTGLSICIFPEGLVPSDESIVLYDFKKGAFRLAINHQLPIAPLVFYDCKKYFSYTFFSGSPGVLRVKKLPIFSTKRLLVGAEKELKQEAYNLIYQELTNSNDGSF